MKNILLFLLFGFIGITLTLFYFRGYIFPEVSQVNTKVATNNIKEEFSLEKAPTQSLTGNIISFSGSVNWQSRIATQPAQLTTPVSFAQGEKIVTGDNGNLTLELGSGCLITISPKTELSLIQTLPANIVFEQESGTVNYTQIVNTPLTIRSLDLLTQIGSGSANIITDKPEGLVTVEVNKGFVTIGYNDAKFISQVATVEAGRQVIFNDETRTIKIKPLL